MSAIQYITTDLEFDARERLDRVVSELGDDIGLHLDEWDGSEHRVAAGVTIEDEREPEQTIGFICGLIEGLSPGARACWDRCTRRVLDVAFESGTAPNYAGFGISAGLVQRAAGLGFGIVVTIYRVGMYSDELPEEHEP